MRRYSRSTNWLQLATGLLSLAACLLNIGTCLAQEPKARATLKGGGPVVFRADGRMLVSAGAGGIKLWDVASGKETATLNPVKGFWSVAITSDGKTVASGDEDERLHPKLWHSGRVQPTPDRVALPVFCRVPGRRRKLQGIAAEAHSDRFGHKFLTPESAFSFNSILRTVAVYAMDRPALK
jgi:WD40 repeat protein